MHSKTQVVAECQAQGASVAGVALALGINANIVHRRLRERAGQLPAVAPQEFVPLPLEAPAVDLPGRGDRCAAPAKAEHDTLVLRCDANLMSRSKESESGVRH